MREKLKKAKDAGMERAEERSKSGNTLMNDDRAIMAEVQMIGGALVTILIIALVLNEVYAAVNINNSSPWHSIVDDLETTGVAAISLLVVGLLVLAATAIMRMFGGGGFGGGR